MTQTKYPKSFYQVFECHSDDMFDYDESKVLFEHDNLAWAHSYAYDEWNKDNTKRYTVIQPYDGSCRGGYGFPEEND
jgi:hypothetical protein